MAFLTPARDQSPAAAAIGAVSATGEGPQPALQYINMQVLHDQGSQRPKIHRQGKLMALEPDRFINLLLADGPGRSIDTTRVRCCRVREKRHPGQLVGTLLRRNPPFHPD